MRHRVLIKDYDLLYEETVGYYEGSVDFLSEGKISMRAFIGDDNLLNLFGNKNCRGKEMEVDLRILPGYVTAIEIKKKTILRLTREDTLVPKYLFIGEVIEKAVKGGDEITIVFDCGVRLDVNVKKRYSFEKLKRGDYVLVIGFLHMYGTED